MSNICVQIIRNHKKIQLNSIRGKRISRYVRLNYADDFIHAITGGAKVAVLTGVLALMGGVLPSHVLASDLPTGGKVISGDVDITQDATNMDVYQGTDKVVVNWDSFDIGSDNTVQFHQPGTSSVALNRVVGSTSASCIYGKLDANGQVFVINSNGVLVGAGGVIHVAGLLASTLDISNNDFLAGRYSFDSPASIASIVNQGRVTADDYVVLAAPQVSNAGNILAKVVHLTTANAYTLNFAGNDLIGIVIDNAAADSLVSNSGTIESNGGRVVMAASSASDMLETVVNNTGVIRARSLVEGENGEIILSGNGGDVVNTGILDASGVNGGAISVSGERVANAGAMSADALSGDGGSINIHADNTVALSTGSRISANAGTNGDGGSVIVFSPDTALFRDGAVIESKGGSASGDGGFVEVSGLKHVEINGLVDASAANGAAGTFLIDPTDITVVDSPTDTEITDDGDGTFTNNADSNEILASLIESYLDAGTNVTLDTGDAEGSTYAGNGDITIDAAIEKTGANSATFGLIADGDIIVNQAITSENDSLSMDFTASNNITINAFIDAHGGVVNMMASGNILLTASGGIFDRSETIGDGAVTLEAAGNIRLDGLASATTLIIKAAGDVINTNSGIISAVDTVSITANQIIQDGTLDADTVTLTLNSTTAIIIDDIDEEYYSINAGALLAPTLDISNNDFLAGRYTFDGSASIASIVNEGRMTVDDLLAAPQVSNAGDILAKVVHLTATNAYTLNFADNDLISIVIDNAAADSLVSNSGTIESNGGQVVMAASSASDMLETVVNNTGIIRVHSLVEGKNGGILLSGNGGDVVNQGSGYL